MNAPKPWAIFAAPTAGIGWTAVTGSEADPLASFNVVAGENYGESVTLEHRCGRVVGEWSNLALAELVAVAREHLSSCDIVQSEVNESDRADPMGPHVQVIDGWLDDNGCLLPDPDGIAYQRTFSDWEEVPDDGH